MLNNVMDFSKALTVVWCCTILSYRGVSGLCEINRTSLTVDCKYQKLKKVPSYIPDSMEVLYMSFNKFKEINLRQFTRFMNLRELHIKYNEISHLKNYSDVQLSTLKVLDISENELQDLNFGFFASFPNLQELNIAYNYLEISMFKGVRNLTTLNMGGNILMSSNPTPFIEMELLKDISLYSCKIQHINKNIFTGLRNLTWLDLSSNGLTYLPSDTFVRVTKLKFLDLSMNPLYYSTSFPSDIFQPLVHLEYLRIKRFLTLWDFPANYSYLSEQIKYIPNLKKLDIPGVPNAKFGSGYTALKNLEHLQVGDNLSEINNETFANLRYARSLKLSLVDSMFNSILPNTFANLENLITLDVSYCDCLCSNLIWQQFTASICNSRLKELVAIYLTCPGWRSLVWRCDKSELELLDMSYGNVGTITDVPSSLKEFRIIHNLMSPNPTQSFLDRLHKLRKLDLSDQPAYIRSATKTHLKKEIRRATGDSSDQHLLYRVSSTRLDNKTKLAYTNFNKSGQHVELKSKFMAFKTRVLSPEIRSRFSIPALLEWIDVSKSALICELYEYDNTNNSIKTFKISSLRPYAMCTANYIFSRIWSWLTNLTMLENLDLSGNHIKIIPVGAFTTTTNLKHVDLSHNSLLILTFEIKCLVNLKEIYLSNNVIRYASSKFMAEIKQDLTIHLDGNNLSCDCTQSNFVHWLSTTNVIYNITGLMCKYENGSQVSLSHRAYIYQQIEYGCNYILVTFSCVAIFAFFLIVGGAAAVVSHKRWKAQYLSAFGRQTVNPYHPLEECNIELEYDIYISYERDHDITPNETLHSLVANKLYPWFQQKGMKVLIREELDIGRKLYEVISNAMRKSRKVIVLLSNDYCIDYWNVFEFNVAAMEGIYTKRRVLIPVAFEILKPEVFHEEIATFIKSVPIPRYTMGTDFIELAEYLFGKVRMAD